MPQVLYGIDLVILHAELLPYLFSLLLCRLVRVSNLCSFDPGSLCHRAWLLCFLFSLFCGFLIAGDRFIPCFHSIACNRDATRLLRRRGSCPVCREPIERVEEGEFSQVCLLCVKCYKLTNVVGEVCDYFVLSSVWISCI